MDLYFWLISKGKISTFDKDEIRKINADLEKTKCGSIVAGAIASVSIHEYLYKKYPNLVEEFIEERNNEYDRQVKKEKEEIRKLKESGKNVCLNFSNCGSTNVRKCKNCGEYVCEKHCYGWNTSLLFCDSCENSLNDGD